MAVELSTTLAPPNTRNKDKEGTITAKRVKKGIDRKEKEKNTVTGTKASC